VISTQSFLHTLENDFLNQNMFTVINVNLMNFIQTNVNLYSFHSLNLLNGVKIQSIIKQILFIAFLKL